MQAILGRGKRNSFARLSSYFCIGILRPPRRSERGRFFSPVIVLRCRGAVVARPRISRRRRNRGKGTDEKSRGKRRAIPASVPSPLFCAERFW